MAKVSSEGGEGSFRAGYENFLIRAVKFAYLYGDEASAEKYFFKLKKEFGGFDEKGLQAFCAVATPDLYEGTVEDLVINEMPEIKNQTADLRQFIDAMIFRAIQEGLAVHEPGTFVRYIGLAKKFHKFQWDKSLEAPNPLLEQQRIGLAPWPIMLRNGYISFMEQPRIDMLYKARVWRNTPVELKVVSYQRLAPRIQQQLQAGGAPPEQFAQMFPPPPNLDSTKVGDVNEGINIGGDDVLDTVKRQ